MMNNIKLAINLLAPSIIANTLSSKPRVLVVIPIAVPEYIANQSTIVRDDDLRIAE